MQILVNALSGIGDALMFTPALSLLKKELPSAKIDALVMLKGVRDLYNNLDEINDVHYFDMLNSPKITTTKFILKLRSRYDVTINIYPSNRREYNLVNYTLNAKRRVGVNYLNKNLQNLGFLNNVKIIEKAKTHCVEENIRLVEEILGKKISERPNLNFPISNDDIKFADEYLHKIIINKSDFVVGIHAGCSLLKNHINRRWEPEKFAELAKRIISEKDYKVLLFGGPEESELKSKIKDLVASDKFINVATNSLSQTAAVIKRSDLFISNDSGLMHIAAAMKRKVISIIGPTNTSFIYPWNTEYKIASLNLDCAPCFVYSPKPLSCSRSDVQYKCIRELEVENVYSKIGELVKDF